MTIKHKILASWL